MCQNFTFAYKPGGRTPLSSTSRRIDFQLKRHAITYDLSIGKLDNACLETTSCFAMELGTT